MTAVTDAVACRALNICSIYQVRASDLLTLSWLGTMI
jgi:hypothetical protein